MLEKSIKNLTSELYELFLNYHSKLISNKMNNKELEKHFPIIQEIKYNFNEKVVTIYGLKLELLALEKYLKHLKNKENLEMKNIILEIIDTIHKLISLHIKVK